MSKKILSLISILFLMVFTLAACGGEGTITIQVETEMIVGETYQVEYKLDKIDEDTKLAWKISEESVAELDETTLKIKALKAGTFMLVASAESGEKASVQIKVVEGEEPVTKYTVTFNTDGGSAVANAKVESGASVAKPADPTKEGYTFVEWQLNGAAYDFSSPVTSNVTLVAKWEAVVVEDAYTITYNVNGGELSGETTSYKAGEEVVLVAPTLKGYEFVGWYESADFAGNAVEKIAADATGDKTFYAKWEVVEYTISYDVDGGELSGEVTSYTVESQDIVLPTPTKEGYTFLGWYSGSTKVEKIQAGSTGNVSVVAKWEEEKVVDTGEYTITYSVNGGTLANAPTKYDGKEDIHLVNPLRTGYTFVGWFTNKELTGAPVTSIPAGSKGNVHLYGKWSAVSYTINYELNGADWVEVAHKDTYTIQDEFVLPTPEWAGHTFLGWYKEADFSGVVVTEIKKNNTGKLAFYAKWEAVEYTVSFNTDGGSDIQDVTVESGKLVEKPTDPVKDGCTFVEWQLNGETYDFNIPVLGDMTLIAIWSSDAEAPVITVDAAQVTVNLFKEFDVLSGVSAEDNIDGDLTSQIIVKGTVDVNNYGTYVLEYVVTDAAGNEATATRTVEVVWGYATDFIGHTGCYYGIANTEEAFIYAAGTLKYQALESDLKSTKDGVFVMCHDDTWGGYTIANTNWNVLKDVEVTQTRTAGYAKDELPGTGTYTSKICSFDRYLEICKEYNVKAVIELKSSPGITNSDQSNMPKLMQAIKDKDMLDEVIFLGSQYNCLIWVKQNGYENIPCQYLVNSCESETALNRCITYGLDISINVTGNYSNSDEWLAKYKAAGCEISTYTFTQYVNYDVVQTWIDKGVDYVTVDWQNMAKLTNYETEKLEVKFLDGDGNLIKTEIVKKGRTPRAPQVAEILGYNFVGWSEDITSVTKDMEVTPVYEKAEYIIKYVLNGGSSKVTLVEKYNYETDTIVLPTTSEMTIEKGAFVNWLDEEGNVVTEIVKGSTGDITLYAKWEMEEAATMSLSAADETAINRLYTDLGNKVVSIIVNPQAVPADSFVLTENVVKVSTGYVDYKYNYGANLFADLTTALANAKDGDIIYILANTYAEALIIDKANLVLAGPNYGIKGQDTRNSEANITGLTTVNGEGLQINGIKFSGDAAIKVGANNVTITNIHMTANQVAANGVNRRGCIVDSANISDLTVSNSYIDAPGTSNSYTKQFMSFNNVTNLSIIDNYITNTKQVTLNSSYAAMRIYTMSGKFICTGNEFRWQTTGYMMILGGTSNTCTEMTLNDNIFAGIGNVTTAGIRFFQAVSGANAIVTMEGNEWYNCSGSTLIINKNETSIFNVKYNYYDALTSFKLGNSEATGTNTTFDHNCYMAAQTTVTNDITTYSSLESLQAAYKDYQNNK